MGGGLLAGNYGTQKTGAGGGLPPITSIPVGNTLYVDAVYGNDGTALPNRFDKPYQTIAAAVAAAVSGDMINIHAGTYFIFSNIAKDGVNFYCEEGVVLSSFVVPFNYDTTAGGTVATIPSFFMGYATLTSSQPFIVTRTNPLVNFTCEFNSVNVTNLSNGIVLRDGMTYMNIRNDYTVGGRNFSMRDTGNLVATIGGSVTSTFANVFNGNFWISGTNWSGQADIKAKTFVLPAGAVGANWTHIYCDNLVGFKLRIELEYLTDTSAVTTAMLRVVTAGVNTAISTIILDIKQITLNTRPLFFIDNVQAEVFFNGDEVYSCDGASITAGNIYYDMRYSISTSTAFSVGGTGTLAVFNGAIDLSAAPGTSAINISGGTLALFGAWLVADSASTFSNIGGTVISVGSGGSTLPAGIILGEFNVLGVYYENTVNYPGGAAVAIPDFTKNYYVNPAAVVALLQITMPNAIDGQEVKISFGGTITLGAVVTALSIIGAGTDIVLDGGSITSANAGDGFILKYQAAIGAWRLF